jgi:hypothetical protein
LVGGRRGIVDDHLGIFRRRMFGMAVSTLCRDDPGYSVT